MDEVEEYVAEDLYVPEDDDDDEDEDDDNDDDVPEPVGEEDVEDDDDDDDDDDGNTVDNGEDQDGSSAILVATSTLPSLSNPEFMQSVREIGHEAVWSLSTAKPGNGVTQIRDSSVDTYWQSDGGQPHLINIQFSKRAAVCEVAFYLDYSLDESYTPKQLSIRTGITFHDLVEVKVVELNEPVGWCSVPLCGPIDPLGDEEEEEDLENGVDDDATSDNKRKKPIRTHFVQICVVSMHQNGRDTHIRQVKIFGPRSQGELAVRQTPYMCGLPRFQTTAMSQFSTIR